MGSQVETTVKALIEFESELNRLKAEAMDAKTRMAKDADSLAETAKSGAILKAQRQASEKLAKARAEAEAEASTIRKKGEASLSAFEASISKQKGKAAEHVVGLLLGETQ